MPQSAVADESHWRNLALIVTHRPSLRRIACDYSRGEGLSDRSLSEIVGRLDRWGVAVLPAVIPEQLCALAERSILQVSGRGRTDLER